MLSKEEAKVMKQLINFSCCEVSLNRCRIGYVDVLSRKDNFLVERLSDCSHSMYVNKKL